MPRQPRGELLTAHDVLNRVRDALTTLASGTNPDNTPYLMPMEEQRKSAALEAGGSVSVGIADTLVRAAEATRIELILSNTGANAIFIRFGTGAAALNTGMRIGPNEVRQIRSYTGEVRGIAATAATVLGVVSI